MQVEKSDKFEQARSKFIDYNAAKKQMDHNKRAVGRPVEGYEPLFKQVHKLVGLEVRY